jgi:type II secretory pathway component PulC
MGASKALSLMVQVITMMVQVCMACTAAAAADVVSGIKHASSETLLQQRNLQEIENSNNSSSFQVKTSAPTSRSVEQNRVQQ